MILKSSLYTRSIRINDNISVYVPTVMEVLSDEDAYYESIFSFIATPYDMMVQLDDCGINFTSISDFDLFCLRFDRIKKLDTSLLLPDLDLSQFVTAKREDTGDLVVVRPEDGVVIDRVIHEMICNCLRKILDIPKINKRPGNEEARKYMIERARSKLKRQIRRHDKKRISQLESYIVALVNTAEFPYNYETVLDISIYQFFASLKQIVHKIRFDNTMIGVYAGTVKAEDLQQCDRSWIQIS